MITVTCDICGKKINTQNRVNLYFNYEGILRCGDTDYNRVNKQLCKTCATFSLDWIDAQSDKRRDTE